ncbi:DUF4132 domain-containing protein [Undibacterium pigrum]|uniref:Uncharacterized protein DUF4132 n=1 Tax=Undibacterium pigrum TaxID=401470 RepID=A0A318ITW0_9BURK|nr:DUF4132 domain-containing protein [Undibacterium pigrum]PXX37327.1 uncharacterized protein DUF4132 [Undibacterium pigrum]
MIADKFMPDQIQAHLVEQLLTRLTSLPDHPRFVGKPADLSMLDGMQLGTLWPAIRQAQTLEFHDPRSEFAHLLCRQAEELGLSPVLDETSALAVFRHIEPGQWKVALRELAYLAEKPALPLQQELIRIMEKKPAGYLGGGEYEAYAIGSFAGGHGLAELRNEVAARYEDSPYRLQEFEVLAELGPAALLALAGTMNGYFGPAGSQLAHDDPAIVLTDEPAYIEFAYEVLSSAAAYVAKIQSGKIPFKADGAFTTDDAQIISRAARIAAYRDETWLRPLIGPLLLGVCVAPTSAKTVPSQSVAITLGHSIEAIPTPESVLALRNALAVVRHAGIEKKLARNLKPAERALAERPNVALRMTSGAKPDKKQQAMLATCMESGFWLSMTLSAMEWRERLLDTSAGISFAASVVWLERRQDGRNWPFTIDLIKGNPKLVAIDGSVHIIDDDSTICLWHPLLADAAERHAWQDIFFKRKTKQPIRQVFREHYAPGASDCNANVSSMFEGHVVSLQPLIGLARREGWAISKYDGLSRQFGDIRVSFDFSANLYPGVTGYGTSGKLHFAHRIGKHWSPIMITELDAVVFSEIARAADLLVSVASFAIHDKVSDEAVTAGDLRLHPFEQTTASRSKHLAHLSTLPLGVMAINRKNTLAMVFATQIEERTIILDERHIRVGEYAVHIATARMTKNGEAVEIDTNKKKAQLAAMPCLPYDEILLQRIVYNLAWAME